LAGWHDEEAFFFWPVDQQPVGRLAKVSVLEARSTY
jgi:hypothetical protein